MAKTTTPDPYRLCENFDVYVEITIERKLKVAAIDKETAIDLGLARAIKKSKWATTRKGYKVLGYEAIDAVPHDPTSA
jgi:hypothetical protein